MEELFSDDSSDEQEISPLGSIINQMYLAVMKLYKGAIKYKKIGLLLTSDNTLETTFNLLLRDQLRIAPDQTIHIINATDLINKGKFYDMLILLDPCIGSNHDNYNSIIYQLESSECILQGGWFIIQGEIILGKDRWKSPITPIENDVFGKINLYQKRLVKCNSLGAKSIRWITSDNDENSVEVEKKLLESICVSISSSEHESGILSDSSHSFAVNCLQKNGVVIIPSLFSPSIIREWVSFTPNLNCICMNSILYMYEMMFYVFMLV